jgi:hypothetical protein
LLVKIEEQILEDEYEYEYIVIRFTFKAYRFGRMVTVYGAFFETRVPDSLHELLQTFTCARANF